jgi:hypothetical protein
MKCIECGAEVAENLATCPSCLKPTIAAPEKASRGTQKLKKAEETKLISSARLAVGFVGLLTLLGYLVVLDMSIGAERALEQTIVELQKEKGFVLDPDKVKDARNNIADGRKLAFGFCAVGFIMILIVIFMKSYPYSLTMLSLVLYVMLTVIQLAMQAGNVGVGMLIARLLIIYVLYRGLQSAQKVDELRR